MTSEECRAKAEECDLLAKTVSYAADRERLLQQANVWRLREISARMKESSTSSVERSPKPAIFPRFRLRRLG
jgi:hypothetical protein